MSTISLETTSLVDAIANQLRTKIFSGMYSPGETLVETRIAEELGVYRPSVRSAVMTLVHEGLLRREPGKSPYIPKLTVDDVNDLFMVRMLVESEAVRRIAEANIPLSVAEQQLQKMELLDHDDGWEEILRLDFNFHCALVDAVGSPRLSRTYRANSTESRLALTYLNAEKLSQEKLAEEHRELFNAIRTGDVAVATEACRVHLVESAEFINHQIQLKDHS
jgi:DNA-binding GntR family transcriptional regulator